MKKLAPVFLLFVSSVFILTGCHSRPAAKHEAVEPKDTITVPDTGYTGIKQMMSGKHIAQQITFKNGVREGLMKTFYISGQVRQTFIYSKGVRQDSSIWYFEEGQIFRVTPYKNDTIDGIQKQYYRTGQKRAEIGFSKGRRTTYFREFTKEGKVIGDYPSLVVSTEDNYKSKGTYKISLALSDKSVNVTFWRGDLSSGKFDTAHYAKINTIRGTGTILLRKSGQAHGNYVGVVGEILTSLGNNYLVYKKIDLPYNDLK